MKPPKVYVTELNLVLAIPWRGKLYLCSFSLS